jgi:hypothetical protein
VPPADAWAALPPTLPPPVSARRWPTALGVAVVGVLVIGVVAVVTDRLGDDGPSHPDAWDPRAEHLVRFVEDERGLDFEHPVHIDFLTPEEYTTESTSGEDEVLPDEREELDRYAGELRALGVASGEIDLVAAFNQVSDGGTLAFYDPVDERVRVRGTEMSVGLEVTLVHELTHALQDQHFDLERLNQPDLDDGAAVAFRALAEGDALRVEDAYTEDELTEAEQTAYDEEYAEELADSEDATGDVPEFVSATYSAPYALGQPFVTMLLNRDGNEGVDEAFESPPFTEEHLFDPASFIADETSETVELGFEADDEVLDERPFGATSWYLFLAERIDPKVAFEAALGWNGDAAGTVERDGTPCVRVAFDGDAASDEDEMASALEAWVAAMPGEDAEVLEVDGHPVLEACDPGEELDLELTGRSETSLFLPNLWGYLVADAASLLDADKSRCYAQTVVDGLEYDDIVDPDGTAFSDEGFQDSLTAAYEACA